MTQAYAVAGYGGMIADAVRMDAYAAALARAVRPGSVVLDIGTGTGMMAMLACRLGAARVHAVEPGDVIHAARRIARDNGMADRIVFHQALSTDVTLPERADVVVSDLRGVVPLLEGHVAAIADARARHLAPGGTLIPRRDTLRAAPVESPDAHARVAAPWDEHARGFDLSAARRMAVNAWTKTSFDAGDLLADGETWGEIDYRTVTDPDVRGAMRWTAARAGTVHGLALWFDAQLAEGIGYTTGPAGPRTIYGTGFFPLERPVPVAAGDAIEAEMQARLTGADYVWTWETRVRPGAADEVAFRQSTFFAEALSPERLRRRAPGHRPRRSAEGEVEWMILSAMDGGRSLEEIARALAERFPDRFARIEDALTRVGRVAEALGG